ncbi:MAG: type II toxin-antitoxin system RelE/ParE family toxin [Pirellulaceae bacterium]
MRRTGWKNGSNNLGSRGARPPAGNCTVHRKRLSIRGKPPERIFTRLERLEMFPHSGGYIAEDSRKIYREIIQGNYRVIYRVSGDDVLIVAVYHAARLLDRRLIP